MSQINLKSITGITSITTPAGVDNQLTLHNNNTTEAVKLDVAGNLHFHNHLSITGVTTHQDDVAIRSSNPLILSNAANNASCQVLCDGGARLHFKSYNQTMATFENGVAITFYTDSGQNRLQINNNGNVFIAKDLDVDGHTNLDNVSIAGVSTFSGNVLINGDLEVSSSLGYIRLTDSDSGGDDFGLRNDAGVFYIRDVTHGANRFSINSEGTLRALNRMDFDAGIHLNAGDLRIVDTIKHRDDEDTKIRFPAADTITFETAGDERVRIDSDGRLLVGQSSSINGLFGSPPPRFSVSTTTASPAIFATYSNNTYASRVDLLKSRATSVGTHTVVQAGDALGEIYFGGSDGDQYHAGAAIQAVVDSGVGNDDMPAYLRFYTNGGSTTASERLRITSDGKFSLGNINAVPSAALHLDWDTNNMLMLDNNSASTQKIQFANNASIHAQIFGTSASGGLTFDSDPSNNHNNSFLNFVIDGDTKAYINSSGQMGLGIVSPQANAKLQVVGRVGATEFYTTTTSTPQTDFTSSVSSNKAGLLLHRSSETNGDYGGLEFHNHPSSITSYRKGGIYYKTNGTGFGRGDMVFANDNAADSGLVTPSDHKFVIKNDGSLRAYTNSNAVSCFSNHDHGNVDFNNRDGRMLHSNGYGWDGNNHADGADPILVLAVENRAGNSDIGDAYGLALHSESQDDDDYGPLLGWTNRSNSGNYNTTYAAIVGKKTGQATDSNWSAGELHFFTNKPGGYYADPSNTFPSHNYAGYMNQNPDLKITSKGYVVTHRNPAFAAHGAGSWTNITNGKFDFNGLSNNYGGDFGIRNDNYSTSNARFTAPVTGIYHFSVNIYTNSTTLTEIKSIVPRINGSEVHNGNDTVFFCGIRQNANALADGNTISGSLTLRLVKDDYIEVWARANITQQWAYYKGHSSWTGHLVG